MGRMAKVSGREEEWRHRSQSFEWAEGLCGLDSHDSNIKHQGKDARQVFVSAWLLEKSKYNSAWHSSLQCCLAALIHRNLADTGCQCGVFVRVFVRFLCSEMFWDLWRTHAVLSVPVTSNPHSLWNKVLACAVISYHAWHASQVTCREKMGQVVRCHQKLSLLPLWEHRQEILAPRLHR